MEHPQEALFRSQAGIPGRLPTSATDVHPLCQGPHLPAGQRRRLALLVLGLAIRPRPVRAEDRWMTQDYRDHRDGVRVIPGLQPPSQ